MKVLPEPTRVFKIISLYHFIAFPEVLNVGETSRLQIVIGETTGGITLRTLFAYCKIVPYAPTANPLSASRKEILYKILVVPLVTLVHFVPS